MKLTVRFVGVIIVSLRVARHVFNVLIQVFCTQFVAVVNVNNVNPLNVLGLV